MANFAAMAGNIKRGAPQKASRLSLPVMVEIEQPGAIVSRAARRLHQRLVGHPPPWSATPGFRLPATDVP